MLLNSAWSCIFLFVTRTYQPFGHNLRVANFCNPSTSRPYTTAMAQSSESEPQSFDETNSSTAPNRSQQSQPIPTSVKSSSQQQMVADETSWETVPSKASKKKRNGGTGRGSAGGRSKSNNAASAAWTGPPLSVEYISPPSSTEGNSSNTRPFLLLLVGLPGSGKSTFSKSLEAAMPYKFARINQDSLKTRKKCEAATKQAMSEGKCVIVDRCNFDESQRQTWLKLAAQQGYSVEALVLKVPVRVCVERCQHRKGHETVKPQDAERVVRLVGQQMRLPGREELELYRRYQVVESIDDFNNAILSYLNLNLNL